MQYKVIRMTKEHQFVAAVEMSMREGWELLGGVSHSGESYMQALTYKEKAIKKPSPQKKSKAKAGGTTK